MKKLIALVVSLVLLLSLAACQSPQAAPSPQAESSAPSTAAPAQGTESEAPAQEEIVTSSSGLVADRPDAVDRSILPITGIGATIDTEVRASGDYTIACIVKNSTNPYMLGLLNGVKKAGEVMGFETILMAPATADSVEEQVKIMEDLIQRGVDGIVLSAVDTNGIMPGVRKAEEAGIPIATIATPAATETFLRSGVDYIETGLVVGRYVAETIGGEGDVIFIEGPPGAQNAYERQVGFMEAMAEYPNITVVASQTANFKRTEGMSVTENLIQKHTNVKAIVAANDESALGAIQALKAAGMNDVIVAGFDGNEDASYSIQNGELFVSYNTDPFGSAFLAATYICQYLNDGSMPPQYFIPFPSEADNPLLIQDTIDQYIESEAWWLDVE